MGRLAGTVRLAALRNTVAHADAHSALAERYPRPALTRSDCPAIKQGRPLGDRSACSVVSCRPSPVPMAERPADASGPGIGVRTSVGLPSRSAQLINLWKPTIDALDPLLGVRFCNWCELADDGAQTEAMMCPPRQSGARRDRRLPGVCGWQCAWLPVA